MTSSLAAQLANVRSHNAERLTSSASLVKHTSYLFPPKTAAQQDLFTVHALGASGWTELSAEDSSLQKWSSSTLLFGDESRSTDRLMLPKEDNDAIDKAVNQFLHLASPFLLSKGASKCLEWLVRRFRIHEFSVEDVLAAFLPYHDTQQFARMLSICKLDDKPHLQFLLSVKKTASPLPAGVLHAAILAPATTTASLDLLRWISGLVANHVAAELHVAPHRALVNFWTSTLVQVCAARSRMDDHQQVAGLSKSTSNSKKSAKTRAADAQAILTVLLPSAVRVAGSASLGQDAQIGGFMLLCTIAQSFPLSKEAIQGIFTSLAKLLSTSHISPAVSRALISCAFVLCSSSNAVLDPLTTQSTHATRLIPDSLAALFVSSPDAGGSISALAKLYDARAFLTHFSASLIARLFHGASADLLSTLLRGQAVQDVLCIQASDLLLRLRLGALVGSSQARETAFEAHFASETLAEAHKNRLRVLHTVRSRKPQVFDTALRNCTRKDQSEVQIAAIWQTVQAVLALESGTSLDEASSSRLDGQGKSDILWLSIHSAEASQRSLALKQLYKDIQGGRALAHDTMVREALHARIQDSSADVLQVLYSQPTALLEAFDANTLLTMVAEALDEDKIPVERFNYHLSFLLNAFLKRHADVKDEIVQHAVWPYLLHSPSRKAIASSVIQLISQSNNVDGLLNAIASSVDESMAPADVNDAIAKAVAVHLSSLDTADRNGWVDFLRTTARPAHATGSAGDAMSRDLSLLTLLHLFAELEGDDFVSLADSTLQSVVLPSLPATGALTAEQTKQLSAAGLQETLKDSQHIKQLETLFKEAGTEQSACLLVNYLLTQLVRRVAVPASDAFLTSQVSSEVVHAKKLLGTLYSVVNTSALPASLPNLLLQILLLKTGDSSLPFLASVWTNTSAPCSAAVRLAALRHADAYLHAQVQASSQQEPKDFQVVVPLLLVALADAEAAIRLAAISGLGRILQICKRAGEVSKASKKKGKELDIYGYESFHGAEASDAMQYIDLVSLVFYLEQLLERKSGFRNDAAVLSQLHGELLQIGRQDGRKEVGHKHAMVCFIVSHILCIDSLPSRLVLLQSLAAVSDAAKLEMLLPLIRNVVEGNVAAATKGLRTNEDRELYLELLFASYDRSCRAVVEEASSSAWPVYLEAVSGKDGKRIVQKAAVRALDKAGLFVTLSPIMRKEIYLHLATIVADPALPASPEVGSALRELEVDSAILIAVFSELRETITSKALSGPESKRARTSLGSDEMMKRTCAILVAVLESAVGSKLVCSGILLYELFEVLRVAVDLHSGLLATNAEQMMQLAMSCIEKVLEVVPSSAAAIPAEVAQALRVDIIVSVVKSSNNPQTFQHALLLLSKIANIAPEAVLHNVMPIFTFVGSTVLQRDDAFSFSVVEKVLQSIVPALVSSLRASDAAKESKFALLCEARAFVRIFTDAAAHVPRHRRQTFFRLLVDVLGADDFAAAVAMLLVDRSAHKIVKQPKSDAEQTLQLPLAVVSPHSAMVQVRVLHQVWEEVLRIWANRDETDSLSELVFLDRAGRLDKEHVDHDSEPLRQVQALIMFIRQVLKSKMFAEQIEGVPASEVGPELETFIQLALDTVARTRSSQPAIATLTLEVLDSAMPFAPVANVLAVVSILVEGEDVPRKTSGFSLFASRVAAMTQGSADRITVTTFTPTIVKAAIDVIQGSLASSQGGSDAEALRQAALDALKTLSSSAQPVEHGPLASTLPVLVQLGKAGVEAEGGHRAVPSAARISVFSISRRLTTKLGPRLIPHIAALVPFCLSIVSLSSNPASAEDSDEENEKAAAPGGANSNISSLRTGALDTMTGLFGSVSTFMTSYVPQIIRMSISPELKHAMSSASGSSTASERSLNLLISAMIRKTPAKDVFEATFKVWDEELTSPDSDAEIKAERLVGISEFLGRALRQSDREAISGTYKLVYRFLLRALDLRRTNLTSKDQKLSQAAVGRVESSLVGSAFLRMVLKLNEASFRPLFMRMFDWAVLDLVDDDADAAVEADGVVARQIVLFKTFNALSETLRSLVSSYYAVLLDQVIELLTTWSNSRSGANSSQKQLWEQVIRSLSLSAKNDEGIFWNPTRVAKIISPLLDQMNLLNGKSKLVESTEFVAALGPVLVGLLKNVNDEGTLKLFNAKLLQRASATRTSNSLVVRSTATQLLTQMWAAQKDHLLGLVPETIAQLSELLEDDDEEIVGHANEFRTEIEAALGESLESYLT
ncbi:related to UTP10 - nucleolar protein, component of the small subunit processome [Ustilago trichophora]|uniref:U3 small nucleolar RNA-associated protein 10 n=1 Tax=Ustilago trichophora TaxID=86804 RepID=A0A5C3E783_9BASI|nr:related to UTP10 - nucleolar protein, component of the small subunit processome [Ustilago trichophora]